LHLVDHGVSPVSLNAAITGVKFFFEVTLDRGELMVKMQPVQVPRILPVVSSRDEAARLIAAARNLKHQTALSVAYGTGLRASEVIALKVGDIEQQRRQHGVAILASLPLLNAQGHALTVARRRLVVSRSDEVTGLRRGDPRYGAR
jgi:integrase